MMTSIVNRIDEWITRVKAYGALKAFEFIPGYPAHKTPSPVTKYTVAVTESEEKTDTFFIGSQTAEQRSGRLNEIQLCLRVYAPEGSSGSALLRASTLLMDALEQQDEENAIDALILSGIGYDTAARVEFRDITARLSMIEEAVV